MTRNDAIASALACFDDGGFRARLAELVAIPSTSQDPAHAPDVHRYLRAAVQPWLERMGFGVTIHANPVAGAGPVLTAERLEDPARPTVLTYGHGDTVRGLDDQWSAGLSPWRLIERGDRWYGRGTADNKGQHAINLSALEAVLAARGRLGFNLKLVLEMSEECGSPGLREFVAANAGALAADADRQRRPTRRTRDRYHRNRHTRHVPLRSRGGAAPRGRAFRPLGRAGCRSGRGSGARDRCHHRPPRMHPRARLAAGGRRSAPVRAALDNCPVDGGESGPVIDPAWGEPGLTVAEKIYGWNSFIVLAMLSGRPDNPVNAVAPDARAHCQIRYPVDTDPAGFMPALRRHLDATGFPEVHIEGAGIRMLASRTNPGHPWVRWAAASIERSLATRVQIIPNASGGLPGDVFADHLGVPLVWVPHSYSGCGQHGPDEHLLAGPAREGMAAMAGLWWDLGETETP
ncbi:MAG: M20/M25/M40 family metallo-hydrolase [Pseudomonadota bacterium]|nr:M20/M25/M40 family metallo-hydrolase [Pseudomonadota bacterium]